MVEIGSMLIGAGVVLLYIGYTDRKNREFTKKKCDDVRLKLDECKAELKQMEIVAEERYEEFNLLIEKLREM